MHLSHVAAEDAREGVGFDVEEDDGAVYAAGGEEVAASVEAYLGDGLECVRMGFYLRVGCDVRRSNGRRGARTGGSRGSLARGRTGRGGKDSWRTGGPSGGILCL